MSFPHTDGLVTAQWLPVALKTNPWLVLRSEAASAYMWRHLGLGWGQARVLVLGSAPGGAAAALQGERLRPGYIVI